MTSLQMPFSTLEAFGCTNHAESAPEESSGEQRSCGFYSPDTAELLEGLDLGDEEANAALDALRKGRVPTEMKQADQQNYMICVDSMKETCNFAATHGRCSCTRDRHAVCTAITDKIICIHTAPQEEYLLNTLFDTLDKIPDGSNVILYLKMHGSKNHQNGLLYRMADNFPINISEITTAINFGRSVKAMSICGILQVCYGSNYKDLRDCFDMCISTHEITRGASPRLINDMIDYMDTHINADSFYEDFEKKLFPKFSKMNTEFLWIFGDVEDKENEIRWNINKNETNISFANFMRVWKAVLPDEKYTQEKQIQIRNTLIYYGYHLEKLIHTIQNGDQFKRILFKLKIL